MKCIFHCAYRHEGIDTKMQRGFLVKSFNRIPSKLLRYRGDFDPAGDIVQLKADYIWINSVIWGALVLMAFVALALGFHDPLGGEEGP